MKSKLFQCFSCRESRQPECAHHRSADLRAATSRCRRPPGTPHTDDASRLYGVAGVSPHVIVLPFRSEHNPSPSPPAGAATRSCRWRPVRRKPAERPSAEGVAGSQTWTTVEWINHDCRLASWLPLQPRDRIVAMDALDVARLDPVRQHRARGS